MSAPDLHGRGEITYDEAVTKEPQTPSDATLLMAQVAGGDRSAADRLLPLVYDQLRKAAQLQMAEERANHTLSATALVHEAYLKLIGPREIPWAGRSHFYAAAAESMRRILLDHARSRQRLKRGGPDRDRAARAEFASIAELVVADADEIVSFDDAICRLEAESPDAARVVRLRFFAGLTVEQTSLALGMSDRTVNRLWMFARAWLHRAIQTADGKE